MKLEFEKRGIRMSGFRTQEEVERIKTAYPEGTRIELISMEDPYASIEPGMQGTVDRVDDIGTLHMKWDNGRTLGIVSGEDSFKVLLRPQDEVIQREKEQTMGEMSF